jgi:uncharacterized protein with von Willebrand factor type A (vWA) domain
LRHLLTFGRVLRSYGVPVVPAKLIDLSQAVQFIDVTDREQFYYAARTTLVTHRDDLPRFDAAFEHFWLRYVRLPGPPQLPQQPPQQQETRDATTQPPRREPILRQVEELQEQNDGRDDADKGARPDPEELLSYSAAETLRQKDFARYEPHEIEQARRLLQMLRWSIAERRSRRLVPARHGRHLDLRRSVRHSLRHGGEVLRWRHKRAKTKPRPLVLICDISGSMDRYSRLLLHFIHTVRQGLENVEAFTFATRLTRITPLLRTRQVNEAIDRVSKEVKDWAGGTRIGQALQTFNVHWARRVMAHGAIVIIISDGWDRGDVHLLRREMEHLQRMSHRLIWLNPLLGSPTYQPLTKGIVAALPYVDDFLPVHNLESLERLAEELRRVRDRRPERRQHPALPAAIPQQSAPPRTQQAAPSRAAHAQPSAKSPPRQVTPQQTGQRPASTIDPMYGHVERHIIPLTGR